MVVDMKDLPKSKRVSVFGIIWSGAIQLAKLTNNWISLFGVVLFVGSLLSLTTYWLFSLGGFSLNRYFEAFLTLVVPTFFMVALVLIPVGILLKRRRLISRGSAAEPLEIRLAEPKVRASVVIFFSLTVFVVLPALTISGYRMYLYTESTEFCGEICHTVMEPQEVAHARSAHARVPCAECHIGAGAGFFVKSKLSGLRQVYAVMTDSFRRPIPLAITELRPARDTCEECHWPSKFFGTQYKKVTHYSPDENNSRREVEIMLKTGGASIDVGRAEGIHMHMLAAGTIEYIAIDRELQNIVWVKHTRKDGEVRIYQKPNTEPNKAMDNKVTRTLDCMDCHNRGAHHFLSPRDAMDVELETKRIDPTLPYILREATNVLTDTYPNGDKAHSEIERRLSAFYRKEYPKVSTEREKAIHGAIDRIQKIYDGQFFPEMKENWRVYPENVGHQLSPGCFRCHDGLHADEKGRVISSNCNTCHSFINKNDEQTGCMYLGVFRHSGTLSIHRKVLCSNCHGTGKYRRCRECHKSKKWTDLRGQGQFRPTDESGNEITIEPSDEFGGEETRFRLETPEGTDEWERTKALRRTRIEGDTGLDTNTPPLDSGIRQQ